MKRIGSVLLGLTLALAACSGADLDRYKDEASGLTFKYPIGWMVEVDPPSPTNKVVISSIAVTSWMHEAGDIRSGPAEGTSLLIFVLDSQASFDEYVEETRAFIDSGRGHVQSEKTLRLQGGFNAVEWIYTFGNETMPGYFLAVEYGDLFLRVTAQGDLDLIRGIVETMR